MQPAAQTQFKTRINQYIKVLQVRLIKDDGTSEILDTKVALKMAQDQNLDLVEINGKASPPIVKVVDFGKHKYELAKKAKADKKAQQVQELKEIGIKPNIEENDLKHKLNQAKEFLADGSRVKLFCKFRGREIVHTQIGREKIEGLIKELGNLIVASPQIVMDGKIMSVLLSPAKKN